MSQTNVNAADSMPTLVDTTRCVGCRSCQVTCKQWNDLKGVKTEAPGAGLGLQRPRTLGAETFTVVTFSELEDARAPGCLRYVATKRNCMHCDDPACASACPVTALAKSGSGAVTYDADKCLGCRYCMWACPWGVPTAERNGKPLTDEEEASFAAKQGTPACVKQCPAGALKYGKKADLLREAHARIAAQPGKYVDHVYGEKEAGGTSMLYLASVPFEQLGLPTVGMESYLGWIAVAAGAFAMAGLIYVFQRKDLYSVGRASVLMGRLSYSFVTVTLLADLGLPWHFYQLALQAPKHSAMFEVSWCVGLYVTVLAFEFFPVPFERWGMKKAMDAWKTWSPVYVALAVPLFVWLMSRSLAYTAGALVVFSVLAWAFRTKPGQKPVPVMLAIAAVTLSTMHQSSLGSLFLLVPDKLSALWWSPVMPVAFFLSSIAAGTALMVLVELWIAKVFGRALRVPQLAAMGKVAFWALLAYLSLRLGDVLVRGQLGLVGGPKGALFLAEVLLGGVLPLALLSSAKVRETPRLLGLGAFLSMAGVVFNRMNVVVFGMQLKGALPQLGPQSYFPSLVEWGISLGLIAATIFLFGLGVRHLPVLPKEEAGH